MFAEKKTENNIINIHINNSQICQKEEVKYLGIVIDKNLKWKPHIDKLTTSDGAINRNRIGIIGISGVFQSIGNRNWSCIIQTRFRYRNDFLNIQGIR